MIISLAENERLRGVFYSIDQDSTPIAMTSVMLRGTAVKVSLVQLNGTFDGTLSADGNTISGKLTKGGRVLPAVPGMQRRYRGGAHRDRQLGLKLESTRAFVDGRVIEKIERP